MSKLYNEIYKDDDDNNNNNINDDEIINKQFKLDEWKSIYTKNDSNISIKWFNKHFPLKDDDDEFSIWLCDYKYNEDLNLIYKTCGMINGWFQRVYDIRKNAFASVIIFGSGDRLSPIDPQVSGIWIFQHSSTKDDHKNEIIIPLKMMDCDDSTYFNWKKLNIIKDKKQINEFFSWQGDFDGRKFMEGFIFK